MRDKYPYYGQETYSAEGVLEKVRPISVREVLRCGSVQHRGLKCVGIHDSC